MADKYPTANGNWSTAANWNGGTLPLATDDVFADGKTIAIDQDVIVLSIRTTQRTGGTNGGSFTCNIARNITGNLTSGTISACLVLSHTVGNLVTLTGNLVSGNGGTAVNNSGAGNVTIYGNITAGNITGGNYQVGLYNANVGTITVNGNVTGGTGTGIGVYGIQNISTGTIIINGNVTGGTGTGYGIYCGNICSITITGTIAGNGTVYGFYTPVMPSSLTFVPNLCTNTNALYVGGAGTYDLTVNSGTCYGIQMPNLVGGSFISTVGAQNCSFGGVTTDVSGGDIISCTFNSTNITLNTNSGNIRDITIGGTGNAATVTGNIVATTGGGLNNNSTRTVNITGNTVAGISAHGIRNSTSGTITINGNVTGCAAGGTNISGLYNATNGTINIIGIVTAGVGNTCAGVLNFSTGTVNITGDIRGSAGSLNYGLRNDAAGNINFTASASTVGAGTVSVINSAGGTITITAGISGILSNAANTCFCNNNLNGIINVIGDLSGQTTTATFITNTASGTINITGNITGNAILTAIGLVYNFAGGTVNIIGNITGGSQLTAYAVFNNSTGNVYITGNIIGGTSATGAPALYSITNGKFDVSGNATADGTSAIYSLGQTAINIIRGNFVNNGTVSPYCCRNITVSASPVVIIMTMRDTSGANRILSTDNATAGQPVESDTRRNTLYGLLNERTGTMYVAPPNAVAVGVPTDDTVGTMTLSPSDFWNYLASSLTVSGSIGNRLKDCATIDSTGTQIISLA
jgi:hypothetical protein